MRRNRPFIVIGIAFLVVGVARMAEQGGGSAAAFIALGATFLAIGAVKARSGDGDAR